jgi:formylglycine-generating enzyme required for sulfatase activity
VRCRGLFVLGWAVVMVQGFGPPSEADVPPDKVRVVQSIQMADLPGGAFFMGVQAGEEHEQQDYPGLVVRLEPFRIAKTDVTFEQYDTFARSSGHALPQDEGFGRGLRPVINVNRREMLDFVAWLNAGTGRHFRLPSEAEWEYAARGGTTTPYFWGNQPSSDYANLADNSGRDHFPTTSPVGSFQPNPFGLFDMAGNVWQAVADCNHPTLVGVPTDGRAWLEGDCFTHIARGGWYNSGPRGSRVTARAAVAVTFRSMGLGFRLAADGSSR